MAVMTNQCCSHFAVLRPHGTSCSAFSFQGCKVSVRKPVVFSCMNAQAPAANEEAWKHITASSRPLTLTYSTAIFILASFGLSIRAASACSCVSQGELPGHHLPLTRDEAKVASDSAELDVSRFFSTRRVVALHPLEADNVLCPTAREFMQVQVMESYERNASEAFIGTQGLRHASIKRMQDALIESSKSQSKSSFNKSSSLRNLEGAILERCAEGNDMGKPPEEWGSVPFKLTVPLRVVSLRASLPPIWLKDFLLSQGKRVRLSVEYQTSLNEIISGLRSAVEKKEVKPKSILAADLVTVGDSWLSLAISGGLIQHIENAEQQEWFKRLNSNWQAFARRNRDGQLNPEGLIWGVPYRWGSMVIAYKKDQFLKNNIPALEDWQDLWRPELKGQIAMVDSPREVVGAVLKSLGASYNAQDFDRDVKGGKEAVKQQFLALQKQVKVFDSVQYVKAFGSDDVWVAVGWSSDVIPVAKRMSNVRVVTPKSGVSLWADFWAIPAANAVSTKKIGFRVHAASPLIHQWFDFCLQPARSLPFKQGIFTGVSPLFPRKGHSGKKVELQGSDSDVLGKAWEHTFGAIKNDTPGPAMDTNMIEGMPSKNCLEKSEFLEPLSDKAVSEYQWLLSQVPKQDSLRENLLGKLKNFFTLCGSSSSRG